MNINLRLIQQNSAKDRENYFALQKSVALFPNTRLGDKAEYADIEWKDICERKNRVCYVIELGSESLYCGECAIKDISADIPEIEIELMKEYQHQGIGYKAITIMLNKLSEKYGKREFCAKIDPDNYASQFLFEKLGGMPAGVVRDYYMPDRRLEKFVETHRYLLDERMQNVAEKFAVDADLLLSHLLVYKISCDRLNADKMEMSNQREHIECPKMLSKEKMRDVMLETLEDLEEIKNLCEYKDKVKAKLAEMEARLLEKMELAETIDVNLLHACGELEKDFYYPVQVRKV